MDAETLIQKLSFTHLVELLSIENPLKRAFYEIECIRGSWSVRELKRQIATLYFERSGLSENPEKLSRIVNSGIEQENTPFPPSTTGFLYPNISLNCRRKRTSGVFWRIDEKR